MVTHVGFLFMDRIVFLIDGFNLYHSVLAASKYYDDDWSLKWLNISSLCSNYLDLISKNPTLVDIYYFSALAHHKGHEKVSRHLKLISALKNTGIKIVLSKFKRKHAKCKVCNRQYTAHEEKETDVALAIKTFELFHENVCDIIVIVSGDTDMAPAVRTAQKLFKNKKVVFLFPYDRQNRELEHLVGTGNYFAIDKSQYRRHKFPEKIILDSGERITKPIEW